MEILKQYSTEIFNLPDEISNKITLWCKASEAYYEEDEPIMSDEQFDELTEELRRFVASESEKNEYDFIFNIINKKIQTTNGLENVSDVVSQMVSLFKIKYSGLTTLTELWKFLNYPNRSNINVYYGLKYDGIAIKVSVNGNTKQIITRGGQDVTHLLKNHRNIIDITRPITHGELVLRKSVFMRSYSDEYSNPRNAVVGVMKQNVNDLDFIECTDGVNPLNNVFKVFDNSFNLEQYYFEQKEKIDYQIDGIVIGYSVENQIIKDNYPTNLVAIKFKSPSARTKVLRIEWTQKKSGNLTPVIIVQPTDLDGSTINKVAGYNYQNLKDSKIGIGSEVEITKSGDIIPTIKKVLSYSREINMPEEDYRIIGKHLIAINQEESIQYKFILGLKLLQLDGIGPVIAEQIGSVVNYDIIELFNTIHKPKIRGIIGTGAVWNNFDKVYSIKNIGLDLLIEILQFDRCGKKLSKKFAEIILKQTTDTSGIDKQVLLNVCKGEGFQKINFSMGKLKEFGIKITKPIQINDDTISFEMTGTPPEMTKAEFVSKLKIQYPNCLHTTITKDTKYLIVDNLNSTSSKCNKARKYNVKIVTYKQALNGELN